MQTAIYLVSAIASNFKYSILAAKTGGLFYFGGNFLLVIGNF